MMMHRLGAPCKNALADYKGDQPIASLQHHAQGGWTECCILIHTQCDGTLLVAEDIRLFVSKWCYLVLCSTQNTLPAED